MLHLRDSFAADTVGDGTEQPPHYEANQPPNSIWQRGAVSRDNGGRRKIVNFLKPIKHSFRPICVRKVGAICMGARWSTIEIVFLPLSQCFLSELAEKLTNLDGLSGKGRGRRGQLRLETWDKSKEIWWRNFLGNSNYNEESEKTNHTMQWWVIYVEPDGIAIESCEKT